MKIKQRIELSVITHEITVVRFRNASKHCERCGEMTPHVFLAEAVSMLAVSADEVLRLAGEGQIHSSSNCEGTLQLCLNSTSACDRWQRGGRT